MHIFSSQIEGQVLQIVQRDIEAMGYEFVRVKFAGSGDSKILQIMLDKNDGSPFDITDCEKASRHISVLLDVSDPIDEQYLLEISSAGLNRPLTRYKDLLSAIDQKIKLATKQPLERKKNFTGILKSVNDKNISLQLTDSDDALIIQIDNIHEASLLTLEEKGLKRVLNEKSKKDKKNKKNKQ